MKYEDFWICQNNSGKASFPLDRGKRKKRKEKIYFILHKSEEICPDKIN